MKLWITTFVSYFFFKSKQKYLWSFSDIFVVYWHQNFGPMIIAWGALIIAYAKNRALIQSNLIFLLFFAEHQIILIYL